MAAGIKTGGRKKGTPNKMTVELRSTLKNIIHKEFEQLPELLSKLEPKERIELLIKMLPYALPKVEPANYQVSEGGLADWTF